MKLEKAKLNEKIEKLKLRVGELVAVLTDQGVIFRTVKDLMFWEEKRDWMLLLKHWPGDDVNIDIFHTNCEEGGVFYNIRRFTNIEAAYLLDQSLGKKVAGRISEVNESIEQLLTDIFSAN